MRSDSSRLDRIGVSHSRITCKRLAMPYWFSSITPSAAQAEVSPYTAAESARPEVPLCIRSRQFRDSAGLDALDENCLRVADEFIAQGLRNPCTRPDSLSRQ